MKKYLIIIFGELITKETCEEIAINITPLVDSAQLKFQFKEGTMIFHFASEISQVEIHDYVQGSLQGMIESFILLEVSDKLSVFMLKKVEEHLFNLESSDDSDVNIDLNSIKNSLDLMEEDEEEDDDYVALLLNDVKKKITHPTLDHILEKISSKGIESLTQFEKDTLDSYSKN